MKSKLALSSLSLVLCSCAAGQASSKDPSSILFPETSSLESVSSSEGFTIDEGVFERPLDDEDLTYQRILRYILEERGQEDYDGGQECSGIVWVYSWPFEGRRDPVASDFPRDRWRTFGGSKPTVPLHGQVHP